MPTTYRKTAKGVAEIETRVHRLTPRMRSALILVDGKRSDAELRPMILQQPDETLAALLEQGFIEVAARSAPAAAVAPAATAGAAADRPLPGPASQGGRPAPDFASFRRDAVRALTDLVGPEGEFLAVRMERAQDAEQLRPLLSLAVQSVGNMRGRQAGADYDARFGRYPPAG